MQVFPLPLQLAYKAWQVVKDIIYEGGQLPYHIAESHSAYWQGQARIKWNLRTEFFFWIYPRSSGNKLGFEDLILISYLTHFLFIFKEVKLHSSVPRSRMVHQLLGDAVLMHSGISPPGLLKQIASVTPSSVRMHQEGIKGKRCPCQWPAPRKGAPKNRGSWTQRTKRHMKRPCNIQNKSEAVTLE